MLTKIENIMAERIEKHGAEFSDNSLFLPNIKEFFYSFFLSYRHVVNNAEKFSIFKKIGMKVGNEFVTFFNSHSSMNYVSSLVEYPPFAAHLIFEYMNANMILTVIQSMFLGRSIVFVADNPNILTEIIFGFQQLMQPL